MAVDTYKYMPLDYTNFKLDDRICRREASRDSDDKFRRLEPEDKVSPADLQGQPPSVTLTILLRTAESRLSADETDDLDRSSDAFVDTWRHLRSPKLI